MSDPNSDLAKARPAGSRVIAMWILTGLAVVGFGGAGIAKIAGDEMLAEQFVRYGFPLWFMTLVGVGEVVGAVGLLVPRTATLAGLGLGGIAVGALVTHFVNDPIERAIPALVLLLLALGVAYVRLGAFAAVAARLAPRYER